MMQKMGWVGLSLVLTIGVGAAACSSSSTDAPATGADGGAVADGGSATGTDGGTSTGSDSGSGTDAATGTDASANCEPIANVAAVVNKDHDPGPPPAMTGGTIVDGTYTLTKMVQYNGENGNTPHKETFVFTGGTGKQVASPNGTGADVPIFFTFSTAGDELTVNLTCGGTGTFKMKYTATPTSVTTVNPDNANELHTLTKM